MRRSTAGSKGSARWATSRLVRSTAGVYWVRSLVPMEKSRRVAASAHRDSVSICEGDFAGELGVFQQERVRPYDSASSDCSPWNCWRSISRSVRASRSGPVSQLQRRDAPPGGERYRGGWRCADRWTDGDSRRGADPGPCHHGSTPVSESWRRRSDTMFRDSSNSTSR